MMNEPVKQTNKMPKSEVMSFRTTPETKQALETHFKENGISGQEVWPAILKMFNQQKFKVDHPEYEAVVNSFIQKNKELQDLFYGLLAIAQTTKEQTKGECQSELESKDKTIIHLQNLQDTLQKELQELALTKEDFEKKVLALTEENNQLKQEVKKLNDIIHLHEDMMKKLNEIGRYVEEKVKDKNLQPEK